MTRISAIIPTYNRAAILAEAISAIQAQTQPIDEILIVDDGSTDETRTVVSAFSGPIQYIYQRNSGKSVALNNALTRCKGHFVWICDDDDIALPNAAELLAQALDRTSAGFAFGNYNRFSVGADGKKLVSKPAYWPDLDDYSIFLSLLEDCYIFQNATFVRKSAYDAVGPFRTDLIRSQDYEMMVRLACNFEAIYVPHLTFLQRDHEGIRGSSLDRFEADRQMERWLHYDQVFFRELYHALPLTAFINPAAKLPERLSNRAALIQRACIYARKKLWEVSLEDVHKAIELESLGPLTSYEYATCGRFLLSKFGCDELATNTAVADSLRSLATSGHFGRSVVRSIMEPMLWHARHALSKGNLQNSGRFAALLSDAYGWRGIAKLVGSRLSSSLWS